MRLMAEQAVQEPNSEEAGEEAKESNELRYQADSSYALAMLLKVDLPVAKAAAEVPCLTVWVEAEQALEGHGRVLNCICRGRSLHLLNLFVGVAVWELSLVEAVEEERLER